MKITVHCRKFSENIENLEINHKPNTQRQLLLMFYHIFYQPFSMPFKKYI